MGSTGPKPSRGPSCYWLRSVRLMCSRSAAACRGRQGLDARIGLEDVLHLPDGSLAPDNAALVRAARSLLSRPSS